MQGGGMGEWDQKRQSISRGATWLARLVLKTHISDLMNGFFVVSRRAFEASLPRLSMIGFKILVDLVASAPQPLKVIEVPYEFRIRSFGESKLDCAVVWEYLAACRQVVWPYCSGSLRLVRRRWWAGPSFTWLLSA
jgi:dolichol-phosphate mannosyltransferase